MYMEKQKKNKKNETLELRRNFIVHISNKEKKHVIMNSNNISLFLSNKAKKEVFFCIFVVVATKQKKIA